MTAPELEHAPLPPVDLADRRFAELVIPAGLELHRFFTKGFDPIHFDRERNGRFNAPDGSYGVLYVARELRGAFAETFLRVPGGTQIAADMLARKAHVTVEPLRPLRMLRMMGHGLARVGATAQVTHGGRPYDVPQAWSFRVHAHPVEFDGIAYSARHDDEAQCFAIFERAAPALRERSRELELDRDWFWDLAEPYGVGLAR